VGSRFSANTTLSGTLWLNFNDDAYSMNTSDNSGQVDAAVGKRRNPDDQYHENGCPVCGNKEIQDYAGDPINTVTGNFNYQVTDLSMATAGETLRFERSYNDLTVTGTVVYSQPIGYGWTHNYDMRLTFPTDPGGESGLVIFKIPHGSRARFTDWGDGLYEPWPGVRATLTRSLTSPYIYQVTTANHEAFVFTNTGRLINQIDPKGNQTTLTYQAGVTLTRVTAPGGARWLDVGYDNLGRLNLITDHTGRSVGYGYNAASDLVVVTDTRGFTWTYTYTGSHLLNMIIDPEGHVVERITYDDRGRAVRQEDGLGNPIITIDYSRDRQRVVTERGTVVTDTYSLGNLWTGQVFATGSTAYTFDNSYNRTSNTDGNGHTTQYDRTPLGLTTAITDALSNATRLAYDANNNLTQITDARGNSSYYTYTGNLLTAQGDALGHTTIYTYNPQNLLIAQQDALGRVTQYEYDPWGQRTVVTTTEGTTHFEYDQVGRLITTTDAFNRVTVNAYDAADHLLTATRNYLAGQPQNYQHAYNLITQYEYDPAGRQTAITDTLKRVTRNVYNENGQLIKTIVNFDPTRGPNELTQYNITSQYGYDPAGRQILVTDTLGYVSKTDYDPQSRPVTVTTNYKNGVYDPAYPDEDIVRVTQYDPAGNAIAQIDPLGRVTRTWYDAVNRVISSTTNYDPSRLQNDRGEFNLITSYSYDEVGNRIWMTDTQNHVTRNYYDPAGRLVSTTANTLSGQGPNYLNQYNLNTFYDYDSVGRQYLVTNTLGLANRTDYDPVTGRPLTTTTNYADGIFDPAQPGEDVAQSTEYDVHGNPYLRRDAVGHATRTWYDELNRVISVTTNYVPERSKNNEGQYNLVTAYEYDEVGNRAWVTDMLGHVTWTQYDALNRAVTVTQNYLPGQSLNYLGQYNLVTTYEYDALGRQVATIDPLGRRTHVAFDQLGRTIAQFDPLEQRTAYAYDVLGNRTTMTDAANHATRFEYDTLNRLVTTTRTLNSNPIREVTHYDASGNRVETIDTRGQRTMYGYDALGRTIAITDANLHVTTFTYDALGRRTAQTDALQHTTVFTSDRLGRQIAAADALGHTTRYGYDVAGNRVVMTDANNLITRYEYDTLDRLSAVIENYTGGSQTADRDVRTMYVYDVAGNRTGMTNARGYTTTYGYDALNRLSWTQDARGKVTAYVYDAVGNRSVMTDANNRVTLYGYDPLNRQTAITYTTDATTIRYAYDAIGNRTAMTDTIGTTQYVFDDLNRLTSVTDPFAQTVGNVYDATGNRTNLIYPDGKVVTYTYDAAGLMTGVIDWAGQTTAYQYDAANRLITVTLSPSGSIQTVYTYDNANRLIHLSHTRLSDDVLLADYEFTLDQVGNRLQVSEAMEYPGDSQAAALPPTLADAIVEAITGHRAPGLSAPMITDTLSLATSTQPSASAAPVQTLSEPPSNIHFNFTAAEDLPATAHDQAAVALLVKTSDPARADQTVSTVQRSSSQAGDLAAPLLATGDIFSDSFESGNFAAWSAAVTNTGKLTVTTAAKRWGTFGMQAQIVTNTALYVRNDTPAAEARYRAQCDGDECLHRAAELCQQHLSANGAGRE
jgi:YD repeat-containing protein